MGQPAHDGDGQPGSLALDQVTGGGELVGGGDDGGAERIAVRVRAAPQIVEHAHSGGPDGDIGEPGPPGPPERVRDEHPDFDAQRVPQPVPDRARGGVGILGQQQHGPGGRVGGVDPGGGHHQPLPVLHDPQRPAPRHDPHGLGVDGRFPVHRLDDPPLGLGHDLRGDQQHIPVDKPGLGTGDQLGEIVPRPYFGHPGQSPDAKTGRTRRQSLGLAAQASRTSSASVSA
jgi:hypothetical protein